MLNSTISNREIWRIAIPIMIGNLAQTLITFTDTAFLGHLGLIELGASMMAGIYYFVFTTMAMGFAIGVQIVIARRFGEGNYGRIGAIFQHGAGFIFVFGLVLFAVIRLMSGYLLGYIVDSESIYEKSMEYISFRQYGIVFVCFNYLFRSLYVGLSNTKVISYSTVIMATVNIILDYCLIFGKWTFPEMGIGGAAFASFCAEMSATLFFFIYTWKSPQNRPYSLFKPSRFDKNILSNIFTISFPAMLQKLFSFSAWFIFFVMIEKMGEEAIGISSVVRSVYLILFIPIFGFLSTSNTLTSRVIGERKSDKVVAVVMQTLANCLVACIPLVVLCMCFPESVLRIYTQDINIIQAAIPSVYVVCGAIFFQAFGDVIFEAVSGTGNTKSAFWLEIGILVLYVLYIKFTSTHFDNVAIVWTAEYVYGLILGIASLIYIKFANWQKKTV